MDEFLEYFQMFRVCSLRGRLGSGKTAFAVLIAKALLEKGLADGVISNFPTILPPHIHKDDGTLFNRVRIFDEAWTNYDARTSMSNDVSAISAYMRKWGCYTIMPSVFALDKRLRAIELRHEHRNIITQMDTWRWTVQDDEKPIVGFVTIDKRKAYGLFATSYIPTNDCGMQDRFELTYYLDTGVKWNGSGTAARRNVEAKIFRDNNADVA
jgi:hypothetical protein